MCSRLPSAVTLVSIRDTVRSSMGTALSKEKMLVNARWENLSAFAAKYTRGFARNVIESVWCSKEGCELPMFQEELCVPCHGVHERDQQEAAEEILKRRRLNYKQAEEMASSNAGSSGSRVELPMALP